VQVADVGERLLGEAGLFPLETKIGGELFAQRFHTPNFRGTQTERLQTKDRQMVVCSMIPLAASRCALEYPPTRMRVCLTEDSLEVLFAPWEKALGLLGNITVLRTDVSDVQVVQEPLRVAMSAGMKAGLRLPWLYYVARTIRLDQAFAVRRGVPALSFAVHNHDPLRHVLVSTPDAEAIARRLRSS
jgi:hypothetical protein